MMIDSKVHIFHSDVSAIALPRQFTFPFHYIPHPLCVIAADEVKSYISTLTACREELQRGKMFGVLVVKCADGQIGYLAAFSGNLAHNSDDYFVPAVYDLLQPDGEFKRGESEITQINHRIEALEGADDLKQLREKLDATLAEQKTIVAEYRAMMNNARERREALRSSGELSIEQQNELIAESQFQKAELRRMKKSHGVEIKLIEDEIEQRESAIKSLKNERKTKSEALQKRLFELFVVNNARGERRNLYDIFTETEHRVPPAGAGECSAPKLLQYAYTHDLQPVAIAEFWWGESPVAEIRHHGDFYPACQSKCKPILGFMLQGLDVEPNPLATPTDDTALEIVYDDQWITIVNKPAGMLTMPGKLHNDSLLVRLQRLLPDARGPLVVHRLDMATSGLLMIAKTKEVHKSLQSQFADHRIAKRYIAILDGEVADDEGTVKLPLRPNPEDRPRQVVDYKYGKTAITRYRVLERKNGKTRVAFEPLTGRTHQLRVHASHPLGLNAPIVGDMLYGRYADRLYLHAESLTFIHPVTGEKVSVEREADF
jgi:tRNA pseudouridine32 synthase/23S rRNA pseudouridine746 synthase